MSEIQNEGHKLYLEIIQEIDYKLNNADREMTTNAINFANTSDVKYQEAYNRYKAVKEAITQCKTVITSRGGQLVRLK